MKQIFIPGLRSWPAKIRSPICQQAFATFPAEPVAPGLIPVRGE